MKYYQEMHYLCMKSAFSQLLDLIGIKDNLLYLKVGNEIKLKKSDKKFSVYKHFPLMPFHNMENIEFGQGVLFEDIFEENLRKLPLIVMCDVFYLPYRKEYMIHHATHAVILKDYKKLKQDVHIIDWYAPHFFDGVISLEDYKRARTSDNSKDRNIFSGFGIKNYWYKINDISNILSVMDNYDRNVLEMLKNEENGFKGIYRGINAIIIAKNNLKNIFEGLEQDIKRNMSIYHDEFFVYYRTMLFGTLYYQEIYEKLNYLSALDYMRFCKNNAIILEKLNINFLRTSMHLSNIQIVKINDLFQQLERNYENLFVERSGLNNEENYKQ